MVCDFFLKVSGVGFILKCSIELSSGILIVFNGPEMVLGRMDPGWC